MTASALLITPAPKIARAWLDTLHLIAGQPGIAVFQIAHERHVDKKAALMTVRTLERRALVTTALQTVTGHPQLHRVCTITAKGRAALEAE